MNFLIPSALLGLGAMLVPLAIHFLSKKKKKEVLFGSLQFLQGSESPSARSIYLSQYLLLLLRMLLIAALCIAVAGPFISDSSEIGYAYIENDILQHETYSTLIEEIGQENTIVPFGFKSDSNCSDCQVFTSPRTKNNSINNKGNRVSPSGFFVTKVSSSSGFRSAGMAGSVAAKAMVPSSENRNAFRYGKTYLSNRRYSSLLFMEMENRTGGFEVCCKQADFTIGAACNSTPCC